MASSFSGDFKRLFGRGLAILLPSIVTLWLLWQAIAFVYANVAEPINKGVRAGVVWVAPQFIDEARPPGWFRVSDAELSSWAAQHVRGSNGTGEALTAAKKAEGVRDIRRERLREFWSTNWYLNLTGFVIAILAIYFAGILLGNYLGHRIYKRLEAWISRVPGFKQVYPHVKQVVDLVMGEKKMAFGKVVLVEYPRPGIWTVAFQTSDSFRQIDALAGERVVTVFIPTSPTPFTGFTINVPASQVRPVDIPVDQALRFIITAGVLAADENGKARPNDAALVPTAMAAPARAAGVNGTANTADHSEPMPAGLRDM
jgi:uncharacterized membrane protein